MSLAEQEVYVGLRAQGVICGPVSNGTARYENQRTTQNHASEHKSHTTTLKTKGQDRTCTNRDEKRGRARRASACVCVWSMACGTCVCDVYVFVRGVYVFVCVEVYVNRQR